jgi:hypothetical protein
MRILTVLLLLSSVVLAQEVNTTVSPTLSQRSSTRTPPAVHELTIPAGTKVPIELKNAISTKGNHEGDPIYAKTTFPVVINDQILIPAGTYMQGRISEIKPAGRMTHRAEVLMHFTTLVFPSGYTVALPGSLENAPAVDKSKVKDKEGTIQGDSGKGDKAATIAIPAASGGALAGGLATGSRVGALAGAGGGAAAGVIAAMLMHGNEVKLTPGMTFEVVIQRDVTIDASRIHASAVADSQ